VLQNLLTRRYLSKQAQRDQWAWLMEHRKVLASRLSELDLRLRVHEDLEVAYAEPAALENPSAHGSKVLRREPLGTYASIVALHLAKIARAAHDEHVLISRDEIHELFSNVSHRVDRDEAMLRARIDEAISRLVKAEILVRSRDDEDSFTISPVISAIMTGQMIDALQREFEQLGRAAEFADDTELDADDTDAAGEDAWDE
jgi:predicted transcriptional regulator